MYVSVCVYVLCILYYIHAHVYIYIHLLLQYKRTQSKMFKNIFEIYLYPIVLEKVDLPFSSSNIQEEIQSEII